jgi:hypothetical protein
MDHRRLTKDEHARFPFEGYPLTDGQRLFLAQIYARFPGLVDQVRLHLDDGGTPVIFLRPLAPNSEAPFLEVWMDPDDAPSIGVGWWHTHGDIWNSEPEAQGIAILDVLADVLDDRYLVIMAPAEDGTLEEWDRIPDANDTDAIWEVLTDPRAPERLEVRSWSGRKNGLLRDLVAGSST